jgi:ABC-2 type transport system ATP-binding protein
MEAHDLELAGVETVQPDLAEAFVEMTAGSGTPTARRTESDGASEESRVAGPPASDGGERQ